MASAADRRERLAAARLYLVIDAPAAPAVVPFALAGGVDVVQLREKERDDGEIVAFGKTLRALCDSRGALLIVNDRTDIALECDADGVHVGQDDEPVDSVRATAGPDLLVGISTHSPEQVDAAERSTADYLGVGPVYATATKPDAEPVGLELVRYAAAHASKPWFAIGGVDRERAQEIVAAGARRVAVVREIRDATDPRAAAAALRAAVEREAVGGQAQ